MWFRRDLRLEDNAAMFHALEAGKPVIPLFIFDRNILDQLEDKSDRRVAFIYQALCRMNRQLQQQGAALEVYEGTPAAVFQSLLDKYDVSGVYANHDYEQYGIDRDQLVASILKENGTRFRTFKDQVIFEKDEIVKDDGRPYTVFTPYSKKWKSTLDVRQLEEFSIAPPSNFYKQPARGIPVPAGFDILRAKELLPATVIDQELIGRYDQQRDFPAIAGTSRLSVHLRFGTISIREVVREALQLSTAFLNELIWRDFYHMISWQMPQVRHGLACKPEYDRIEWRTNEEEFEKWCAGKTGYPIVDAGMRELNATGFMHNRVRMITASFLCKHLLIDWRWGESYFAAKLLDYDFAANNGGWQWVAGSGCDAAPYFRIFSPAAQSEKFDRQQVYIRKWVPELDTTAYPSPMVDHQFARQRCLEVYGKALKQLRS